MPEKVVKVKSRESVVARWMTVVGNGLVPFRLVEFAEGGEPLPYDRI